MTYYVAEHESQYGSDRSERTRTSGCVWATLSTGVDAQSGGQLDPEPDAILALVKRSEETNPLTPGWSLIDAQKAMARLGVPFSIRSGAGWDVLKAYRDSGFYVVLQGDSDRFATGCSGAFDGDHCIGLPPGLTNATGKWAINDPICTVLTYQSEATIRAYAEKFRRDIAFGVFTVQVPTIDLPDTGTGDEMIDLYAVPGRWQAQFKAGAQAYDAPGGNATSPLSTSKWFDLVAQDAATAGWYLLDGGIGVMRWAQAIDVARKRDLTEYLSPPNTASVEVNLGGKRYIGNVTST